MVVEAHNNAAYDIRDGTINVIGLDDTYFSVTPQEVFLQPLEGKNLLNPEGGRQFVEFYGNAFSLFENADEYEGNYFLKARYRSTMDFSDTVCVSSQPYQVYDQGCTIEAQKSYSGQGAPLAITAMDEVVLPNEGVEFRFTLSGKGEGIVEDVRVVHAQLGGEELGCAFQGTTGGREVRFTSDEPEQVLICRKQVFAQSSYSTTLSVSFDYTYSWERQEKLHLVR